MAGWGDPHDTGRAGSPFGPKCPSVRGSLGKRNSVGAIPPVLAPVVGDGGTGAPRMWTLGSGRAKERPGRAGPGGDLWHAGQLWQLSGPEPTGPPG